MSHVMYTCTAADLAALDAVAKQLGSTREGVISAAVEAFVSKPPKKLPEPEPEPQASEPASRRSSRKEGV